MAVALRDFDGVVDVFDGHGVVGDVVDSSSAAAALEIARHGGLSAGPDLDAGTVAGVGHGDVVNKDVFYDISLCGILSERTDTDAVTAIAFQVLDQDVGAVGFERDAIVTIADGRVLNDDVVATISVPSILYRKSG